MTRPALLRCRCGTVEGEVSNASPSTVNRVVCYCDDCQAFLHHLDRSDLLDAHGGTDIVQVAPASLTFHEGTEHLTGLRLTPKGLYRWYTSCCSTPVGNTIGPAIPFVGIVAQAFDNDVNRADDVFGRPIGGILGRYAIGTPPPGTTKLDLRLIGRAVRLMLGWRLTGRAWPHPFFDRDTRAPRFPVAIVPRPDREALRARCGPRPAASVAPG